MHDALFVAISHIFSTFMKSFIRYPDFLLRQSNARSNIASTECAHQYLALARLPVARNTACRRGASQRPAGLGASERRPRHTREQRKVRIGPSNFVDFHSFTYQCGQPSFVCDVSTRQCRDLHCSHTGQSPKSTALFCCSLMIATNALHTTPLPYPATHQDYSLFGPCKLLDLPAQFVPSQLGVLLLCFTILVAQGA